MKLVKRNQKLHNPDSPLLIGEVKDDGVKRLMNPDTLIYSKNYVKLMPLDCHICVF